MLREASRDFRGRMRAPHDIIFVAHAVLATASMSETKTATAELMRRARLLEEQE